MPKSPFRRPRPRVGKKRMHIVLDSPRDRWARRIGDICTLPPAPDRARVPAKPGGPLRSEDSQPDGLECRERRLPVAARRPAELLEQEALVHQVER